MARTQAGEPEFLLVTAKGRFDQWIFPKGHAEAGETLDKAALRELREEAGVEGTVIGPVGSSRFDSRGEDVEVTYFLVLASTQAEGSEGQSSQLAAVQGSEGTSIV